MLLLNFTQIVGFVTVVKWISLKFNNVKPIEIALKTLLVIFKNITCLKNHLVKKNLTFYVDLSCVLLYFCDPGQNL